MTELRSQLQRTLGDAYTIERELGGGGMSRVFVARENALGRTVVVKVIAPELAEGVSAERFAREVKLAARLQQANIVPVLSTGASGALPFYTMPFVAGESLRARLTSGEPLTVTRAVSILRDVARALSYAHAQGVVHRDIKPENILLSGGTAVVTDFGIAKALSASRTLDGRTHGELNTSLTQAGGSIGTPAYMSPEQSAGDPSTDHRTDLYAWGVMAWELFVGRHPFADAKTPHAMLTAHIAQTPASVASVVPAVPLAVSALVQQCLAKDPAERPASADVLLRQLDDITTGEVNRSTAPVMNTRRGGVWIATAVLVCAATLGAWWFARGSARGSATPTAREKSVAVLPFESLGGDTANTYFAEGIADELSTALARVPGMRVAATSSAFSYRGRNVDARDVGKALSVANVLQGRVRRAGSIMRVTVQLIDASTALVLWGNDYERDVKDLFAVQDELSRDIVAALKVTLANDGTKAPNVVALKGTNDLEAYDLFLHGLHFLQLRGGGVARSIDYFQQAIARDSAFARAWAQLGTSYAVWPLFAFVNPDSAEMHARVAIDRALVLDPASAEAYAARGISLTLASNAREAIGAFERAVALDPTYGFAHRGFSAALLAAGRDDEAAQEARLAVKLDPLSAPANVAAAVVLLAAKHRAEALDMARRAVELDSTAPWPRVILAYMNLANGQVDEARRILPTVGRLTQGATIKGYLLGVTGDRAGALAFLREIARDRGHTRFFNLAFAWTYLGLGDRAQALAALERAAESHEPIGFAAAFNLPGYDSIRRSVRFAAVLRRYGLNPSSFGATATEP